MNRREAKKFLIHERISEYFRPYRENGSEETKQCEMWISCLKEIKPVLARDFVEYMDWLAEHSENEHEGLYPFVVLDGIQTAKDIAEMLYK